jgi:hypothetical protein
MLITTVTIIAISTITGITTRMTMGLATSWR